MFNTQSFVICQTAIIFFQHNNNCSYESNRSLSSTTGKINRISNHFLDRWRYENVVNLRETQRTSKSNIERRKGAQIRLENCH